MYTGWTQAYIKRRNCEWDLNQGRLEHLEQEIKVFPLYHSLFVMKLHLTLIITLRMYTGWTQANIKTRNCEWDLNQGRLEHLQQESEVFPLEPLNLKYFHLDHPIVVIKLHLTFNYNI